MKELELTLYYGHKLEIVIHPLSWNLLPKKRIYHTSVHYGFLLITITMKNEANLH